MKNKKKFLNWLAAVMIIALLLILVLGLNGCAKSDRVNYNIKHDADNFKVRRRVVALNTRTNEALFEVEGLISISTDSDGDLNVTIQTDSNSYKLFYAHLSDDVTYTCIQLSEEDVDPYAYSIQFFPPIEVIQHGLVNVDSTD